MQISHLNLSYGNKQVLSDISARFPLGSFSYIIGTSGSGKSSLLHCFLGGNSASGSIEIEGFGNILALGGSKLREYRRSIGVVFQDFKLLEKKTVKENVSFALEVSGYSTPDIARKLPEILSQVGLLSKKDQFIEHLSGGEQQRVAIARALIHEPKILIADEPTGNLDPKNAHDILQLFLRLHKQGKTVIMATHDTHLIEKTPFPRIEIQNGSIISHD